jgi:hypothetical protein
LTNSIHKNVHGPDWPLGFISVPTPGVPVSIMSLVDPAFLNSPDSPTVQTADEYTWRAHEIILSAYKPGASHGMQLNTGNVYICRKGAPPGTGNRDDTGSMFPPLTPGQTLFISSAALNFNVWSPYEYFVDADNAGDGVIAMLIIQ